MISCKFIYQHNNGAASDSLNQDFQVIAIPHVGDELAFIGKDGNLTGHVVKKVLHLINPSSQTAEVWIYYGA